MEAFAMISFGTPTWFWGMAVLPLLALLYLRAERRSTVRLRQFAAAPLLPALVGGVDRLRRGICFSLVLLALALALLALAQPRWGYVEEKVQHRGLDLLLAVDTSRSMLSNDVSPNRLERVKLATQDLLSELKGDRVGLIAFAGRAFLQAPLTIDYSAAVDAINDLDTKSIPEGGTNISEAIALATRTFGKSAQGNRALVIFTDGEELNGDAVKTAQTAAANGIRVFTIGVGTPEGSLIPVPSQQGSEFVKDGKGQVVKSRLDENRLREIAKAADGQFLLLGNGPRTMQQLYENELGKMQAADFDARLSRRPIERYEWPLGASILALIGSLFIGDRRKQPRGRQKLGKAAVAGAALLLVASSLHASAPGLDAYQQQKYDDALKQFETELAQHPDHRASDKLQFDTGAAAYKVRDYNKALQSFSQALLSPDLSIQSKGHYNLGNTLYQRGEGEKTDENKLTNWNDALKHYEETLKLDPQNREAKENYEFVKNKIEELKKKKEQPSPTPSPTPTPTPSPQDKKKDKQDQKDQQKNKDQQQNSQSKDQQQQQQKQDKDQQQQPNQNQQQNPGQSGKDQQQQKGDSEQRPDQKPSSSSPTPTPSATPTPSPSSSPGQSPTPGQSPSASPSGSPGQSPSLQPSSAENSPAGAGSSPTPSPGEGSPSPSAGAPSATPSPSAGEGSNPSPSPGGSPDKPRSGEIKSAGQAGDEQREKEEAAAAEAEALQRGEMTPGQAARLLQAMKDDEARVQLDERRLQHPVYKDW
ncbi:MAG: VWA domain-containing protein [Verrucomicrobiota bacterium]